MTPEEEQIQKHKLRKERNARLEDSVNEVLEDTDQYNTIVNRLLAEYVEELDSFTISMDRLTKDIRSGSVTQYTELQLEMRTIVLAHALHKAAEGLGILGSQSDIARMTRETKFADTYKAITGGTIPDKKAQAEEYVLAEKQVESLFQRAYQTLSAKIKSGNRVLEALKKVLTSRNIMQEVFRKEYNGQIPDNDFGLPEELNDADDGET